MRRRAPAAMARSSQRSCRSIVSIISKRRSCALPAGIRLTPTSSNGNIFPGRSASPTACGARSRADITCAGAAKAMQQKTYNIVTAVLFLVVALLHLLRIILDWPAQIGGLSIPLWASWLALIVAAALAYLGFRQNARLRHVEG